MEIDVEYTSAGDLSRVYHGWPCDCTCKCVGRTCAFDRTLNCYAFIQDTPLFSSPCNVESGVGEILTHLASKSEIALVYIDAKVYELELDNATQVEAGNKTVMMLVDSLFSSGYGGKALIGILGTASIPFLRAAIEAANHSAYGDRIYFTIDQGLNDPIDTLTTLQILGTSKLVYGIGVGSCIPVAGPSESTLEHIAVNQAYAGVVGMTYTWTVDKRKEMKRHIRYVQGIITNYPARLKQVLDEAGIAVANQSSTIPDATSSEVVGSSEDYSCDCSYQPVTLFTGGCAITRPAPNNMACYCSLGIFGCSGYSAQCRDPTNIKCQSPDNSFAACNQGRGICG